VAHIGEEVGKVFPSLAKSDAASAVLWICLVVGICAASFHQPPTHVFRAAFPESGMPVLKVRGCLFSQASATLAMAVGQNGRTLMNIPTAIAPTQPQSRAIFVGAVPFENQQFSESLTFEFERSGHAIVL
jgi:hypothetical protein